MDILSGVRPDTRPQEAKSLDYVHEDLYGGLPPVWIEKKIETIKLPSQRFQDGSYSCIFQSSATALEVLTGDVISALEYQLRTPHEQGAFIQNAGDILYNIGTNLEKDGASQNMNDAQLDSATLPKPYYKVTGYRTFIDRSNIDNIAEAIQAYGNCVLTFGSNAMEWQQTPFFSGTDVTFYHAICAVDFGIVDSVKVLICRDSAGQSSSPTGIRLITEDYLQKRSTGAIYYLGAKKIVPPAPVTPPTPVIQPVDAPKPVEPVITPVVVPEPVQPIITPVKQSVWSLLLKFILSLFVSS